MDSLIGPGVSPLDRRMMDRHEPPLSTAYGVAPLITAINLGVRGRLRTERGPDPARRGPAMARGEALLVPVALLPARPRLRVGCGRPGEGVASPTPLGMALRPTSRP
ncbi:hypothetical protein KRM28CT15_59510 [Krasilnikovia sp. M28-CT-15]